MYSRRRFLRLPVAATVAGLIGPAVLVGCSDSSAPPSAKSGGGTLRYGAAVEPDSWDPHAASTAVTGRLLRPVLESLVSLAPDGTVKPWLAESWTVSPDGLTYTFTLRTGVTFSDGTPFDAAAVKANFDHITAPKTASKRAAGLLGPYKDTEVVDPRTVAVHLTAPHASLLNAVGSTFLGFHSPVALRDHVGDLSSGGPFVVGTGPFTFESVTPGQQAVFKRRPDYAWAPPTAAHQGQAKLESIVVLLLKEDASRVGALTSGQVDAAELIPANRLAGLRGQNGVQVVRKAVPGVPYTYYLNTARAPFDDLRARQAARHAIDFAGIVKGIFQSEYEQAWGPLAPSTPGADASLAKAWEFSKEKAERLLDEIGYTGRDSDGYRTKDGKRFTVEQPYVQTFVSAQNHTFDVGIQDALKQVGIELKLVPLDSAGSIGRTGKGDYDVFAFAWQGSDPSLLQSLYHSKSQFGGGGANGARVRDSQIDGWLDQAQATVDAGQRLELYRKVQRRIVEQAYSFPAYIATMDVAQHGKVSGLVLDVDANTDFYGIGVA
ncbi:ABC transporter substrate-binding protein [Streptomyces sp. BE20]|uniref:ABC transporter substrate-binding protein n=1 Tax=Streptomyces sp. BE20 TaxID=3002525 RepID=UPI002E77935B|nr:ABC transporter substrate-binding protein [Streptomyces sp. BE20]MEE1825424.1 ABC transporter substrate-binding protein [Streptomyces sp. BE20]